MSAARMAPKAHADHSRVPELDGIRALAIWMVLVDHIFLGWPVAENAYARMPGPVFQAISHGWLGVDLFFVLSGFLITGILLDSREKDHYFRNFYVRRFLRIMPLYFTVVIAFAIFYSGSRPFFVLSTLFAANLSHLFGITQPHGPGVLWSLAVEEHFYFLWPVLVYALSRRHLAMLAAAIIVVTPIARGMAAAHGMPVDTTVYQYSWFRFDGLALGGLLAVAVRSSRMSVGFGLRLAALCLALSAVITVVGAFFGLGHQGTLGTALRFNQAHFVFGALLVLAFALRGTPFTAVLRTRFMRTSGDLSYCLYLIHLAIGDGVVWLVSRAGWDMDATFGALGGVLVRGAAIVVIAFSLAALSKRYLEEPFLRLKSRFTARDVSRAAQPAAVPDAALLVEASGQPSAAI